MHNHLQQNKIFDNPLKISVLFLFGIVGQQLDSARGGGLGVVVVRRTGTPFMKGVWLSPFCFVFLFCFCFRFMFLFFPQIYSV